MLLWYTNSHRAVTPFLFVVAHKGVGSSHTRISYLSVFNHCRPEVNPNSHASMFDPGGVHAAYNPHSGKYGYGMITVGDKGIISAERLKNKCCHAFCACACKKARDNYSVAKC